MSDFEREERAFRAAFAREAAGFEPRELSVPESSDRVDRTEQADLADADGHADAGGREESPTRRRATLILAAAAAVVTVVGLGGAVASFRSGGGEGSTVASESSSKDARDGGANAPQALSESAEPPQGTYTDKKHPGLPAPEAGKRWAVRYDLAAQVPQEWADAASPALPECIEKPGDQWDTVPRTPYVANVTNRPVPRIACDNTEDRDFPEAFGKVPFALWQPYLEVEKRADADGKKPGSWDHEGWQLTRVAEGDYLVSILTGPGDDKVNQEIQGSLRTVAKDPYGCETASPLADGDPIRPKQESATSPLNGVAPDSVAICQYEPSSASLTGSRETTGADAATLVTAISAAPGRSGPNTPKNCLAGQPVASYVILRVFRDGEPGDVYVSYENCDDHGFYDGKTVHELTAPACRPVFAAEPVTIYSAQGDVARVCLG